MPEAFIELLFYNFRSTWALALFFVMWPLAFGLGGFAVNTSSHDNRLGLGQAMRRSVTLYLGFDKEAVETNSVILHRIVGALAWAYVVAIFIASIG